MKIAKWILLLVMLMCAYIYATPYVFLFRMNRDLKEKNYSSLARNIDFEAVQDSFELQIESKGALTSFVFQKSIDRYLTPQGIEELLSSPVLAKKSVRKEIRTQIEDIKEEKKELKKMMKEQLQQIRQDKKELKNNPEKRGLLGRRNKKEEDNVSEEVQVQLPSQEVDKEVTYDMGYQSIDRFDLNLYQGEERYIQLVLYRSGVKWKLSELWLFFLFDELEQ
ncbi:MAG: hypothetical protein CMK59_08530 [Proteobacteria bacterium]|nr:hypothetical protein [Pseudomonadota bacterium]